MARVLEEDEGGVWSRMKECGVEGCWSRLKVKVYDAG